MPEVNKALIFALIEHVVFPITKDYLLREGRMPTDAEVIAELRRFTTQKIDEGDAFLAGKKAAGVGTPPTG